MGVQWDMAAFYAALAIFAGPHVCRAILWIRVKLLHATQRMPLFEWEDFPTGTLHECPARMYGLMECACPYPKETELGNAVTAIFNKGWEERRRNPRFVGDVPDFLSPASFIRTDARTVLAFILLTVGGSSHLGGGHTHLGQHFDKNGELHVNSTHVSLAKVKGVILCHAEGRIGGHRHNLTKLELELMLAGYPPWYRQAFRTHGEGFELSFPLSTSPPNMSDVSRGGWIVALGLMQGNDIFKYPLTFYTCSGDPESPRWRENGLVFRKAIRRCLDHINRNIQPHFLGEDEVATAVEALTYMLREGTGSGVDSCSILKNGTTNLRTMAPIMPRAHCEFVMRNFNEYKPLELEHITMYKGVLLPAMAAVVQGSYEVVQYLKDYGTELRIPAYLQDLKQEVYLVRSKTEFRQLTS